MVLDEACHVFLLKALPKNALGKNAHLKILVLILKIQNTCVNGHSQLNVSALQRAEMQQVLGNLPLLAQHLET
jgi:hypothetical protein